MKALILAGGRGKRLGTISEKVNKCMLEVLGKPLLEYSLYCAASLEEISEIVIVVGYRAEDIINTYGNFYKNKKIKYVIQWEQKGVVDAMEWAKTTLENEDFMLMLGDELLCNPKHREMIKKFKEENLFGICGVVPTNDIDLVKKTYTIIQSEDNRIFRLVEKPNKPFNNIMGTGNCLFKNEILSYISQTPINQKRGEKELPDLIQCAIDDNNVIKSFIICDKYININYPEEINKLNSYFAHF